MTMTSLNGSSFVSNKRRGSGSLGTKIGGDGSRASIAKRTGIVEGEAGTSLRKTERKEVVFVADAGVLGTVINSCFRRAKVSAAVGGGRGGSMGRKTNGSCCDRYLTLCLTLEI